MARILLGVSGGIAAYKALEFVRLATGAGHSVRVVQTPTSRRFVGEASFAALTGAPVLVSEFQRDPARGTFPDQASPTHDPLSHLQLVANADIYLIAPASANTIAKLAGGMADNLLCSCALAATCPVLLAPAMNHHMYEHAATQANLQTLSERGVQIVAPGSGHPRASTAWGAWPSRASFWAPARRRSTPSASTAPSARTARPTAAVTYTGSRCSSAPGARASRSTACASSATAAPDGWASRWPTPHLSLIHISEPTRQA